jgi:hypothetical protein
MALLDSQSRLADIITFLPNATMVIDYDIFNDASTDRWI